MVQTTIVYADITDTIHAIQEIEIRATRVEKYLIGSFSGLFVWDKSNGYSYDFFTGKPYQQPTEMSRPISENMVSGWIMQNSENPILFDQSVLLLSK